MYNYYLFQFIGLHLTFVSTQTLYNHYQIVCNDSASNSNTSPSSSLQLMTQEGDHCLEITQGQTYHLLFENDPEDVTTFVASEFDEDIKNGNYLNMIPEPSKGDIRTIYPASNSDEVLAPPGGVTKPVPPSTPAESIVPDVSEGSNTAAIAGGVSIAVLVAAVGLFVARRRMIALEQELKDDGLESLDDDNKRSNAWSSDDDSSSSGSSSSSSSSGSSSGSESSDSTSGSSSSYYSNSGSTSGYGTSNTKDGNAPISVSASDTDSYASQSNEQSRKVRRAAANAKILNSTNVQVHDSGDSESSVDEASLVEEAALEDIDSDSDHDSHHSDDDHHEYEMNIDLTDADGLEIPHMGRRSKESSDADDSSAGSSGWNSSDGDSSSTNTESVESFDANLVDTGSSAISKNNSSETDEMEDYAYDRELLPGTINPAVNPVVQPGVSMLPVADTEDDDIDFMSNSSESSDGLVKRDDAPPMGHEIQSAIEQGDWAAVGATAAILTSQPEGDSTSASLANTTHTSEMEALVNSANWSGIVAVAARYADDASIQSGSPPSDHANASSYNQAHSISSASLETADESSAATQSESSAGPMSHVSNTTDSISVASVSSASYTGDSYTSYSGAGTSYSGTGAYTTSGSDNTSEVSREMSYPSNNKSSLGGNRSPSGANQPSLTSNIPLSTENPADKNRINAYRAEVEALIRRVVPDEIDNVDAIMIQFNGREEELIATLRGMQEKTIAQRAKAAVQRSAKKEAKTGGRIADDYTASSEEQSSVIDSTYTSSVASINDHGSIASTVDEQSITEEFADHSSHSGIESASEYSGSANEMEEGSSAYSRSEYSRSDYSQSQSASEYTNRSGLGSNGDYSESKSSDHGRRSGISSSHASKEPRDDLDNLVDSEDLHSMVDRDSEIRERAREYDLD